MTTQAAQETGNSTAALSQSRQAVRFRRAPECVLAAALLFYVTMAILLARVKIPWPDEAWITSPAVEWARSGHTGIPTLEPSGTWLGAELTGADQYCYWNLPAQLFVQGVWYTIFGFSILTMRAYGIGWGLLGILSWFVIVSKLTGSRAAGSLAAVFLAVDFVYLWTAADGRMDMMCAALGWAGMASYLLFRERHWTLSLALANSFLALSVFTHPNAVMPLLSFVVLVLWFDRRRVSWRDLPVVTPYLLLATLWCLYILHRPDLFLAQFGANAGARGGVRWMAIVRPLQAAANEVVMRWLVPFTPHSLWSGDMPSYALLIPLGYWAGLLGACLSRSIRRARGFSVLLCLALGHMLFTTFFVGLKTPCYLVFVLPFYATAWSIGLRTMHVRKSAFAPLMLLVAIGFVGLQIGIELYKIRTDSYRSEYLPAVDFVRSRSAQTGGVVAADAYFGLGLGLDRLKDDTRLGFYTGVRPALVVADEWYANRWNSLFTSEEPYLHRYVAEFLETEYIPVFQNRRFRVYERKAAP